MNGSPTASGRVLFKRGATAALPVLLQTIFSAEILSPSTNLWLVSPWVSDIPILDNELAGFRHIEPRWPLGVIRLSDLLAFLVARGTNVHVATRPTDPRRMGQAGRHNDRFLDVLQQKVPAQAALWVHRKDEENLHTKGLLGDSFFLAGSMNFTHTGITVNDEHVRFTTSAEEIARARLEFRQRWGTGRE